MIEVKGNLWDAKTDAICITTNGFVKKNGKAVMGRGCAREAVDKYPGIDSYLGLMLADHGNHVHVLLREAPGYIVSFPVKHNWYEKADINLIKRSSIEITELANSMKGWKFDSITIPRPGCGNGQLDWETEVKPVLEPILDDRFQVISF